MQPIIQIENLSKVYANGFTALKSINLDIREGEIIALLGPNGAGKTTLISIVCGIVKASSGSVRIGGYDNVKQYRAARSLIGLVPQELATDSFESVNSTFKLSRGLFGKAPDQAWLDQVLKDLSLFDKKHEWIIRLSGGMKRRVMIGKALAHQPRILFLDEPTAGVDVELRQDMWQLVRRLREDGVTIILTTHYLEEAEEMADRIGVINKGELMLVEDKQVLMRKLGEKRLFLHLTQTLAKIPEALAAFQLDLSEDGLTLIYRYDKQGEHSDITQLLGAIEAAGLRWRDLDTEQHSLEEIFVNLVRK
ncbi:MAG: ABC transporter ATP-binding protein [Pseudomonadales bacterium]|jgi:ABC-2 type transport system ATP-binding protein|nr:ABC transporter ATP-binding protein [Pseudomonadales bacterium]